MRRVGFIALLAVMCAVTPAQPPQGVSAAPRPLDRTQGLVDAASHAWLSAEWNGYAARFVAPEGRVRDNGNNDISHSEGQGYGLVLAAKAGDANRFEALWRWTREHLFIRKDGHAAWRWDPVFNRVDDTNNATDGDILIAWGLLEGAKRFKRDDYRQAGTVIARAIASKTVLATKRGPVILPGAQGFAKTDQPDGPVINLSYWVFPALPALQELAPETDWSAIRRTGLAILAESRFGAMGLPTDWESLAGPQPQPAQKYPAVFGYNAIRIPLYLASDAGADARRALSRFASPTVRTASSTPTLEVKGAPVTPPVSDAGYDLVLALARCITSGDAIPPEMISTRSTFYYPETLRLLSVVAIQERFPACL